MAQVDTGGAKTGGPRKRRKPQPAPAPTAPPRQADTGDVARARPAPRTPPPAPAFRPRLNTVPFARQQAQAQRTVRATTRQLPAPALAAPPIISGGPGGGPQGKPMTRAEVNAFLNSRAKITQTARSQIVNSIRTQVSDSHGQERVDRIQGLMDEIATNPKLAHTRKAIRYYAALEQETARPNTSELRPGPPDTKLHGPGPLGFATLNVTAVQRAAAAAGEAIAPGLQGDSDSVRFFKNAAGDIGTLGTAPFIAGAAIGSVGKDVVTGHPGKAASRTGGFAKQVAETAVHDWSNPAEYFRRHPVFFALDVSGAGSVLGRTAGAVGRTARLERASTVRSPLALGEDIAAGVKERRYSKDLIRSSFQRARDQARTPLRDASGNIVTVEQAGRRVPVLMSHEGPTIAHPKLGERGGLNAKRGDVIASRANSAERLGRDVEGKARRVRGVPRAARDGIVSMVARGVITSAAHMHADLTNYVTRVSGKIAAHDLDVAAGRPSSVFLHEGELEAAKRNVALANRMLRSPRAMAQAEKIVREGERHGRDLVAHDTAAAAAGLFEGGAEQARRARLVETAVEHMGGTHGRDARLTQRAQQARAIERSLQARLNFGHVPPAQRAAIQQQIEASRRMRQQITARNTERLRDRHGNPLEPHQIEAFLRSRGRDPGTVAYLPPNVTKRQFHKQLRPDTRGSLTTPGHVRTGAQAAKGAVENSREILQAAGVRHVTTLNKAKSIDRLISEHGMRHPAFGKAARGEPLTKHERAVVARGGLFTPREAAEAVTRAENAGQRLVAVRAYPGRLDKETQRIIREDLQGPGAMDSLGRRLLNDRFLTDAELKTSRTRNVVLVDADLIERLNQHLRPSSGVERLFQLGNRAFRYAVLPQVRWMVGNFFEPLIVRMPGVGSGINVFGLGMDITAATRTVRKMERSGDPAVRAAAAEIRAHQFGGLLFGNRGLTNRRTFAEVSPAMSRVTEKAYGKLVQKIPATRQAAELSGMLLRNGGKALLAPLDLIFAINRAGESGLLQRAAFGKSVRHDIQEFTGKWTQTVRLGQQALEDVGKGLVNTPAQARYLEYAHELLGKYEGFSPTVRAIIQGPAPFLPWMLNTARFVYWTMPAHRSAQTALLVRLNDVVAKDWEDIHKSVPPGMGLAIPNGKGGWVDVARYTPYGLTGALKEGEFRGVTSQLLPQFGGVEAALEGKDPFGRDLQMSDHQPADAGDKLKVAANSGLEAFVPYLSNFRRILEHGETGFSDSTAVAPKTKPGTSHGMSGARRVLDPFRPTYLTAGGAGRVISAPGASAPTGPLTPAQRRQRMLLRRAARTSRSSTAAARRQQMLLRRAGRQR